MAESVHISLGSNLGDRGGNVIEAALRIDNLPDTQVAIVSSLCETEPVGVTDQPRFINAVVEALTELEPEALLHHLLEIERTMRRVRTEPGGPRTIDLDLLLHGDTTLESDHLTIPHPRMAERHFVLVPLLEIAPDLCHPLTGQPWREILQALPPTDWGRKLTEADE